MKKVIILAILVFLIVSSSTALGGGYTHKTFRGFVFNLDFDKKPDQNYWQTTCTARVLIGKISTWQIYDKIDEKISILRKIELIDVFKQWLPDTWLKLNYRLDRTIVFTVFVTGRIVEK
jgi:hypothetical protein